MTEKKIVCVKLDQDVAQKLERIAKSKGIDKSKLLRELIEQYLGYKNSEALSELDKLVSEAKAKMDQAYAKWIKHCEEHVREVASRNPSIKEAEMKESCLKSVRGLMMIDLQEIAREYIIKIKAMNNVDNEVKREYYRKVWGLIDQYLYQ